MKIVKQYRTTGLDSMMVPVSVQNQADQTSQKDQTESTENIAIDPDQRRQPIVGFGASFTDSSASLLGEKVDSAVRARIMRALFSPTVGAGLSVVRQPMGACDYSRDFYTYDDMPAGSDDPSLSHFSIEHDKEDILPLLREARDLNPQLFVIGSPWSAPAWMKDSGSLKQGHLLPHYQRSYANYFVRFVQDYQANGIEVNAITPQNEPLYEPPNYSGLGMPAADEARFVHEFLRPAFTQNDITTQIWGYDHNWDHPEYAEELLERAEKDFDGIAWHWYAGDPSVQSQVSRRFPNVPVYFTEGSGGSWIPAYTKAFSHLMGTAIDTLNHGSRTFVLWNIALDQNNGPTVPNFGKSTCRGLFRVDTSTGRVKPTLDYYGLAHFSTAIDPQSTVLNMDQSGEVKSVAAANPDGSIGLVLWNSANHPVTAHISLAGSAQSVMVPLAVNGAESMRIVPDNADGMIADGNADEHISEVGQSTVLWEE